MKLKFYFIIFVSLFSLIFIVGWNIVDGNYDKQNKGILFLKKIIPTKISRKIRDTLFIIPDLKTLNKDLMLQVKKYEQGYAGELFREEIIISEKKKNYNLKEFFLPFPRLDVRNGYYPEITSKRAHYLEIVKDKVICISGEGETIFFYKNNIFDKKLKQQKILNNIENIIKSFNAELVGIRDLFIDEEYVYISMIHKDLNGYTINLYKANLNFESLNFEIFFKTNEYWPSYNVFSGGRISKFIENKILFSIGFSKNYKAPQELNSFLGKIISIEKNTKDYELISIGHRNPQGLFFFDERNLIINTEHGPKGGDEINFNFFKKGSIINFGWPNVSYGAAYPGEERLFNKNTFSTTHKQLGFAEPFKYYELAIGISEVLFLKNKKFDKFNNLFVSSMRAGSIYAYEIDENLTSILHEDRIYFGNNRLRDLDYDAENNVFFITFEMVPSVGILKLN